MTATDLERVNRSIARTRGHIDRQRQLIERLENGGHSADVPQAEALLKTLEESLRALEKSRDTRSEE